MIQFAPHDLKEAVVQHLIRREASLDQLFLHWIAVEEISDFVLPKHEEVALRLSLLTQDVIYYAQYPAICPRTSLASRP